MSAKGRFCAFTLLAVVAAGDVAFAEVDETNTLQAVEQDLAVSHEKQLQLQASAQEAVLAQDQLSDQLIEMAATAKSQERDLAKVEKRLRKLKNDIAERNLDLASQQDVIAEVLAGFAAGSELGIDEMVTLFEARGPEVVAIATAADQLRQEVVGEFQIQHLQPLDLVPQPRRRLELQVARRLAHLRFQIA